MSEEFRRAICGEIQNVDKVLFDFAVEKGDRVLYCVPVTGDGVASPTVSRAPPRSSLWRSSLPGGGW